MRRCFLFILCLLSIGFAAERLHKNDTLKGGSRPTSPVKPAPSLVLESASNNENSFSNGEFISVLRGNVVFRYDDIRIRSDEATWWRTKGAVLFKNRVRVVRGRSLITCNRMNFTKDNNTLTATGKFDYFDSTEQSRLKGETAEYRIGAKIFHLRGSPELIRYDTAQAETLTIKSITMIYVDSLKRATAVDSVRIRKGKLYSTCRLAHFNTKTNQAFLRGNPNVYYDAHHLNGDSINLNFAKERLHDASIVGNSHGIYLDVDSTGHRRGDTSITHIWGDSLYMALSDSGRLNVLWSVGKASSRNYESSDPASANTANGKIMMLRFGQDGNVKKLKIWGNARSTYFVDDDNGKGCNNVSGDSIAVAFAKGKAQFVTLAGSTRGIYFPVR
jgi:lipopolysaccharide export system protein LptA